MRSIAKFSAKLSLAALAVALSVPSVLANTLSEIQINAQESGYGVVLKADEAVPVKKTVTANNKLSIELKDVEVSADLNTVYNNVENIDNVTVVPSGKSGIKIVVKGQNVSDSKIYFDKSASKPAVPVEKSSFTQSIQLSAPVSSFTPVYNPDAFAVEEEAQTSNPQLNEILTKMNIDKSMLVSAKALIKKAINKTKSGDINMMTVMGVLFIMAAFMLRPPKKSKQPAQREQSLSSMLSRQNNKSTNLRTPQMNREIALNKDMASSMNLNKRSALNSGYGMKAYQNSQRNPYTTNKSTGVSGIPRRSSVAGTPIPSAPIKKQTVSNKPVSKEMNSPIRPKAPSVVHSSIKPQTPVSVAADNNTDSMKFLESITKIYEKSGRADLAKGLKDNLQKARSNGHAMV